MFRVVFHSSSWTWLDGSRPATFTTGSSTGLINVRYCRHSAMSSWRWVRYHPKHVEQLTDLNKLYSVASCWTITAIFIYVAFMFICQTRWMCGLSEELRPLDQCDRGFETRWSHGCSSVGLVMCCVGSGLCTELITRSGESYRLCVSNCVWSRNLNKEVATAPASITVPDDGFM